MNGNKINGSGEANNVYAPNVKPAESCALAFDPNDYSADMEEFDITAAEKAELLTTLWSIMRTFVEMGLDVDILAPLCDGSGDARADTLNSAFNNKSNEDTGKR